MNGSCAGGTGAFIDQMATLLKMSAEEMNKAAEQAQRTYTIASRCGVFAKSDVQPLINQGARTEDIAASIYKAVVNQTIAGLAQGRPIKGNILYLGGPLTFSTVLRKSFDEALNVTGTCPENSLLYVALGAALCMPIRNLCSPRWPLRWTSTPPLLPMPASRRCSPARRSTRLSTHGTCPIVCPAWLLVPTAGRCISASTPVLPPSSWWWWTKKEPDFVHQLSAQPWQPAASDSGTAASRSIRSTRGCRWPALPPPATARNW